MTDETFVNQNDVEGTASGVWSRMLAGNRRFAEGKLEHPNAVWKRARRLSTRMSRMRRY